MNGLKPLTELKLSDLWREVKVSEEEIWGDLKEESKLMVKKLFEGAMEDEILERIGISRKYERTDERKSYLNGYYKRDLESEFGLIEGLSVPRVRDGKFKTSVFTRYKRRRTFVERAIMDMFLAGVSTRRVAELLEPLIGSSPSAQTVSNLTKELDRAVKEFHRRRLERKYLVLIFDGVVVKMKVLMRVKKRVILCAYGIREDGVKELIDFRIANSESEEEWSKFLNNLYMRGLEGEGLRLVVTDGAPGLHRALDMVYPYIKPQRCWVHKLRNIGRKLPRKYQEECLRGAKRIYLAESKREAIERFKEWKERWKVVPKAVECLEKDLEEMLVFFDFPEGIRSKIRTTNGLERVFREIRRRIKTMSCFENEQSCERIIYALISYYNKKWERRPLHEFTQFS